MEKTPGTTYELLSFMHVLSVPGKASIEATKAAVVSLKFLRINKDKQKTGKVQRTSTTTVRRKTVSESNRI